MILLLTPGLQASYPQAVAFASQDYRVYLPLVRATDGFGTTPALWAAGEGTPAAHEVVLLRCSVNLDMQLSQARLDIFADTRYEVWLNGSFLGRGPARFSHVRREYDQLNLGELRPGEHLIAILGQWAPNMRRSESLQPQIQLRLSGWGNQAAFHTTFGPEACRAIETAAWRSDAVDIHRHKLLGPSEQLDFRQLPSNWSHPQFIDTAWPQAIVQPQRTQASYQPRSIPLLDNISMPFTLREVGEISSFWVGELTAATGYRYQFTLANPTSVTLRSLEQPQQASLRSSIHLNGEPLEWNLVPGGIPDLRQATILLPAGQHELRLIDTVAYPEGWPFALSPEGVNTAPPLLGSGNNPGRRMMLAELVRNPSVASLHSDGMTTGQNLIFTRGASYAILDLGRTVHGRIRASIVGPTGALVDIGWDDRLWQGVRPLPSPGSLHPELSQADSWVLDGTPRTLQTIDARAGRYILITVWGAEAVELRNLQIVEERYPVTLRGSFQSSNARLNQIWQVGINTLYPSMFDAYADPWRERGQWWGDAFIADRVNRVSFGEFGLLRRGIEQLSDSARINGQGPSAFAPNGRNEILFDYAMMWVQSLYEYGKLTGDWMFIAEHYAVLQRFMELLESHQHPQTGLLEIIRPDLPFGGLYIDSSSYWERFGQTTAANAFYYRALRNAAAIAGQLGHTNDATRWQQQATQLRERVNQLLYRPDEGHYVAGIFAGEVTPATPQSQAAALAFDLPPDGEEQRVADSLLEMLGTPEDPVVQILGMYNVLEGLARIGRIDDGLTIIDRFFGALIDRGATTWWENFIADRPDRYWDSFSHAWGGSPTWFLSTYVLGAQRTGPATWQVRYHPSQLRELEGTLPLPQGELAVRWNVQPCQQIDLSLQAPLESSGEVILPGVSTAHSLSLNGEVIWIQGQIQDSSRLRLTEDTFVIELSSGDYELTLLHSC